MRRVNEGTRTPDRLDHNQELYQLSYVHHETDRPVARGIIATGPRYGNGERRDSQRGGQIGAARMPRRLSSSWAASSGVVACGAADQPSELVAPVGVAGELVKARARW
jgi:hypothetical protein